MTKMGKAMDTTLFVKNGPCMAGLGLGGEGYVSFSIATPTGEGVTTPLTFTRERRCSMIDDLRILGKVDRHVPRPHRGKRDRDGQASFAWRARSCCLVMALQADGRSVEGDPILVVDTWVPGRARW